MAMQPTLWSMNALAVEFGLDRRTVAKRLTDVPPAGEKAGHPVWRLVDVLPALTAPRAPRAAERLPSAATLEGWKAAELDYEELLAELPDKALAGEALMRMAYRLPATVASLAVAAGAPCKVAFATGDAMHMAAMMLVAEVARELSIPPWAENDDPEVIEPEAFEAINWPALAETAGEPLDLEGWRRWTTERFGEPDDPAAALG